jgi:hypothetical protein
MCETRKKQQHSIFLFLGETGSYFSEPLKLLHSVFLEGALRKKLVEG